MVMKSRSEEDRLADELAAKAAAGSVESFERLVVLMGPRLLRFLVGRIGDAHAAEDALQETLIKAYRHLGQYNTSRRVSAWLFTIAAHEAVAHWRSHRKSAPLDAVDPPDASTGGALDGMVADERRQGLWAAAAEALSEQQYAALWMRYVEGLAVRDIAGALDKSPGSVKVMLHRACRKLMDCGKTGQEPFLAPDIQQAGE